MSKSKKDIWTEEQTSLLTELYPTTNTRELAKRMCMSYTAVKARAGKLGLLKSEEYKGHTTYGPWTDAKDQILIEKYPTTPNKQLCEEFGVPDYTLQNRARTLGLNKNPEYVKKINKAWPDAHVKFLKENYGKITKGDIAKHLGRTPGAIKSKATNLGLKVSKSAAALLYKSNAGSFTKGNSPTNTLNDGAITLRHARSNRVSKPYYYIRIGKKDWYPLHQYIWDNVHGKPPKGFCVAFKDGNTLNVLLDNLELITRGENMKRNSGSINLPDSYVASLMARHDPDLKDELLNNPDIITTKRLQLELNREIKSLEK